MSAITDALKKAHMDTARQRAVRGHRQSPPWHVDLPRERRRATIRWLARISVVVVVLGMIGGGAYLAGRMNAPRSTQALAAAPDGVALPAATAQPAPANPEAPAPRPARAAAAVALPEPAAEAVTEPAVEEPTPRPRPEPVSRPVPEPVPAPAPVPDSAPVSAVTAAPLAPLAPPPKSDATFTLENGATYVGTVNLSNNRQIRLTGITLFGNEAIALVNRDRVQRGSTIEGFTVVAIERRRLELRRGEMTIFLALP